jgi:hypothetical protein
MKKILVFSLLVLISTLTARAALNDPEFTDALKRAYDAEMTKWQTEKEYQPLGTLTREQAAKMFSVFGMSYLCLVPDADATCAFSDSATADPTLQAYLKTACQLGLFKGTQGKFLPKQALTKAQALTVLVRAMSGSADENGNPRRSAYFAQAQALQLTKETSVWAIDKPINRYESLLLQYRAKNAGCATTQDNYSPKLLEILEEILWPGSTNTTNDLGSTTTDEATTWSQADSGTGDDT